LHAPPPPTAPLRRHRARTAAPAVALCCGLIALAGCGGSSHADGTEADPATAVPSDAALYLGATVRPSGSMQTGAEAVGRELTGRKDPYVELAALLQTPGSAKLDYKRDVAPWLGPHAGLYVPSLAQAEQVAGTLLKSLTSSAGVQVPPEWLSKLGGAVVMDTSDASSARAFLAAQAKRAGAKPRSYRGVSYEVGAGTAFALVGRFAVVGAEAAVRRVIGVTQGEPAVSSGQGYKSLAAAAPSGAVAHVFVDLAKGATGGGSGAGALGTLRALLGEAGQANVSVVPAAGALTLDVDTAGGSGGGLLGDDPEAAKALEALPGESWLALGIGHAGTSLPADVAALKAVTRLLGAEGGNPTLSLGSVVGGLLQPLSVLGARSAVAQREFRSWMGRAGIFGAGSSVLELKAGVAISSNDAARSRVAVSTLAAALRAAGDGVSRASISGSEAAVAVRVQGLPLPLDIAAGPGPNGPLFVLGLGEGSVAAAFSPAQTLASSAARSSAASALGEGLQPSLIADVPTLLTLLESVGLTEEPSLKAVLPYLRATSAVAGGGGAPSGSGEVRRFKLAIELKH
jgi:hypothetical protein